jgi:hypothetical protein
MAVCRLSFGTTRNLIDRKVAPVGNFGHSMHHQIFDVEAEEVRFQSGEYLLWRDIARSPCTHHIAAIDVAINGHL